MVFYAVVGRRAAGQYYAVAVKKVVDGRLYNESGID